MVFCLTQSLTMWWAIMYVHMGKGTEKVRQTNGDKNICMGLIENSGNCSGNLHPLNCSHLSICRMKALNDEKGGNDELKWVDEEFSS